MRDGHDLTGHAVIVRLSTLAVTRMSVSTSTSTSTSTSMHERYYWQAC